MTIISREYQRFLTAHNSSLYSELSYQWSNILAARLECFIDTINILLCSLPTPRFMYPYVSFPWGPLFLSTVVSLHNFSFFATDEFNCNKVMRRFFIDCLWHYCRFIPWICYERSLSEFYLSYMKPISFQSKASVVCSVTAAIVIDFCLKKLNLFSQHIGQKTNEYLNFTEQIPMNWNVDQLLVLITSWDNT